MNAFSFVWLRLLFVVRVFSESGIQPLSSPSPEEHGPKNWGYLVDTSFHNGALHVIFGPVALLFVIAIFFGWLAWWYRLSNQKWTTWEPVEVNLKIGEIGDVKIAPNYETRQIAYKAWVELSTRKIGLPFDPNNDVIIEIYDSWHSAFTEIRNLLKTIPIQRFDRTRETRTLVELMITVLNRGLRPHLNRWQARFRTWYQQAAASPESKGVPPQLIQSRFAEYEDLKRDLQKVQSEMVEYIQFLSNVARGEGGETMP
jgi:hypothetical protein